MLSMEEIAVELGKIARDQDLLASEPVSISLTSVRWVGRINYADGTFDMYEGERTGAFTPSHRGYMVPTKVRLDRYEKLQERVRQQIQEANGKAETQRTYGGDMDWLFEDRET